MAKPKIDLGQLIWKDRVHLVFYIWVVFILFLAFICLFLASFMLSLTYVRIGWGIVFAFLAIVLFLKFIREIQIQAGLIKIYKKGISFGIAPKTQAHYLASLFQIKRRKRLIFIQWKKIRRLTFYSSFGLTVLGYIPWLFRTLVLRIETKNKSVRYAPIAHGDKLYEYLVKVGLEKKIFQKKAGMKKLTRVPKRRNKYKNLPAGILLLFVGSVFLIFCTLPDPVLRLVGIISFIICVAGALFCFTKTRFQEF